MKKLPLVLAVSLCSQSVLAADLFIGATLGNQWSNTEISLTEMGSNSESSSNMNAGIRAGAIVNDTHRFTGSYTRSEAVDKDFADIRSHLILASYDYLVPLTDDGKVKWFAGVSAGAAAAKSDLLGNEMTAVLGAQTGVQYNFDNNISVELGYRYLNQDIEAKSAEGSYKLDHTQQLYVGADYRF
ncbi:MAG: outer membrane beta-barrel protein [Psychromonas sp.]